MLPSDEKSTDLGLSSPAGGEKNPAGSLQNPLHGLYGQSAPASGGNTSLDSGQTGQMNGPSMQGAPHATASPSSPAASFTASAHHAQHPIDTGEEVWVERTKAVIAQTQNDPHKRVQALQQLRASYQAERYNRSTNGEQSS